MRFAVACVAAAALAASAAAQPPMEITGEGTEAFRAVVARNGLKPISDFADLKKAPGRCVLIVFQGATRRGELKRDPLQPFYHPFDGGLKDFVEEGGAVLIATDQDTDQFPWLSRFDARVDGRKVFAAGRAPAYRDQNEFPYVKRYRDAIPDLFQPARRDIRLASLVPIQVATNRPSFLAASNELEIVSIFMGSTRKEGEDDAYIAALPFAQAKRYEGGGRILLMADHSVFINSMLLPSPYENANLDFTQNCLSWLTVGPGNTPRDTVLFINDGKIETDFNVILREMPPVTPEEVMKHVLENPKEALKFLAESPDFREFLWENRDKASQLVGAMEDSGVFSTLEEGEIHNRAILSAVSLWQVVRTALFVATLGLLGFAALKFLGSKWKFAKNVPRLAVVLDRFRPRAGLLEQRLRDGVAAGQYYEAARERAQLLFADLGLTPAAEGPPPAYTITAGWQERGRIDRELRDIWAVAYGIEPRPIPAKAWLKWPRRLAALRDWIQNGVIRFE